MPSQRHPGVGAPSLQTDAKKSFAARRSATQAAPPGRARSHLLPCEPLGSPWNLSVRENAPTDIVQTPEPFAPADPVGPRPGERPSPLRGPGGYFALGERLSLAGGLVLCLSSFMSWYAGSSDYLTIAVIGWHTGILGKLVFFVGLAVLGVFALREAGFDLPPAVPESLAVVALGSLATIFVLIRLIDVPDEFAPYDGRGIGIWISLLAALTVIAAGLLEAAEEL
jgi:hypothetical protein